MIGGPEVIKLFYLKSTAYKISTPHKNYSVENLRLFLF